MSARFGSEVCSGTQRGGGHEVALSGGGTGSYVVCGVESGGSIGWGGVI